MRKMILFLIPLFLMHETFAQPTETAYPVNEQKLVSYLKSNWKSPEDYVINKFKKYDIVFIGEMHRVKHDVELIHNLIPRLYKAGVYNLGIEFGGYEFQDKVDRLITDDEYDENLARWLMFQTGSDWGYKEYHEIYRKAWELNKSLPKGKRKFRVVNLNYKKNWKLRQKEMTRELWQQVWHKGDPDAHMAQVILAEFVDKNEKALIYMGAHHAFTRYRQPIYDFEAKKFLRFETRAGNLVYEKIPDKVFNIFLHAPFHSTAGYGNFIYPVGGVIDRVMERFKNTRVGFDVKGTPFGELRDERTLYSHGYTDFKLADFCDGYIFQKTLKEYEPVTIDTAFITKDNLQEAIDNIPNPAARKYYTKPEDFIESMRRDIDFKRKFRNLE